MKYVPQLGLNPFSTKAGMKSLSQVKQESHRSINHKYLFMTAAINLLSPYCYSAYLDSKPHAKTKVLKNNEVIQI
jgi:hypothetical protein